MNWLSWLWVLIPAVLLGRLIAYSITGPDRGTLIIDQSQGMVFFAIQDQRLMMENMAKISKIGTSSIQKIQKRQPNDALTSSYLDISHPCNSFYDAVCGTFDSTGTDSFEEDEAVGGVVGRSSGLFYEVIKFSQALFQTVLDNNTYYKLCESEDSVSWLEWPNIHVPDFAIQLDQANVAETGMNVLAELVKRGIQTPLTFKVEKLFHEPVFGIVVEFNMLPMMDIAFHESDGNQRPLSLTRFYEAALALNPNIIQSADTIQEYVERCGNLTKVGPSTRLFLEKVFPNVSKVHHICVFGELEDILTQLSTEIAQDPFLYWDYFHKMTVYYETLPYLSKDKDVIKKVELDLSKLKRKWWLQLLLQNFKVIGGTKSFTYSPRTLLEKYNYKRWSLDLVENLEFQINVNTIAYKAEFIISSKTNENEFLGNTNLPKDFCSDLTQRVDRFTLNKQYALSNEIQYKSVGRTDEITTLMHKVVLTAAQLINESRFHSHTTKDNLMKKLSNLIIKVKGVNEMSDVDPESVGFLTMTAPKSVKSTTFLFSGIYKSLHNTFHLNQIKLSAPSYVDYRVHHYYHYWDDLLVPYEIVNAWYDPTENTITIPTGITLLPMGRGIPELDEATIGVIFGHETGHSLDNNGRLFDELGNYAFNNTPGDESDDGMWHFDDVEQFNVSMNCLAEDYGHPCGNQDYGHHTMGEDIADQIGVRTGLRLLMETIHDNYEIQYKAPIPKSLLLKEFFVNYAKLWCGRSSVSTQCDLVKRDPHALAKHRVNKTLRQIMEFMEAFGCKENSKMYKNQNNTCLIYK